MNGLISDPVEITNQSPELMARQLAALAHPARIGILQQLAGCGPSCCGQVVENFDLAQSTVSQHLKVLVEAGLVQLRPVAQRSFYEVDAAAMTRLLQMLSALAGQCCDTHPRRSV
jgi:ArsR family transcriptional regulator